MSYNFQRFRLLKEVAWKKLIITLNWRLSRSHWLEVTLLKLLPSTIRCGVVLLFLGYVSSVVVGITPFAAYCQVCLFCKSVEAVVLVAYVFARVKHVLYFRYVSVGVVGIFVLLVRACRKPFVQLLAFYKPRCFVCSA